MRNFLFYIKDLYAYAKLKILLNLVLMVLLGLLEGIGILMLIPFLSIAGILSSTTAAGGADFWLKQFFSDLGTTISLPVVLLIYTGIIFVQSWLRRYQSNLNTRIQQGFYSFLSIRMFQALAYTKWSSLMARKKSDVTHLLTGELARVSGGTQYVLQMTATAVISTIQIGIAFLLSPGLTFLVLLGGMAFFCWMQRYVKEAKKTGASISQHTRNLFFDVTEHLNGIKEVKTCGMETRQIENFIKLRQAIENNFVRFNRIQSGTDMLYRVGAAVFISIFLYSGIEIFQIQAEELLLMVVIFARLWPRLSSLQVGLQQVAMMLPAFQAVLDFESQCLRDQEKYLEGPAYAPIELRSGIELKHVFFRYQQESSSYALRDISFSLPAGTTTALVGVSGSGKSTVADLITGLITPQQGEILIDGTPIANSALHLWRRGIGYVPQDAFLFHASIRDNMGWAHPGASEEEIWKALKMAAIDEFAAHLPERLNTVVGDRGVRLSGGERQRMVLARALLRKPSVLILDEATSSLDGENEKRIYQAIESLHGRLTILVIAHRLSTIRKADQIIVLDQGRIVEKGNYANLMENKESRLRALAAI
ncbi:ABC transporter ATP-binding protein [Candidatus Formimonas warabiya]|uniref:ABC transporter ATP-binding protein n=1 Tax=Formimonas warabiya TaxID=1761012 RepID=UPI0011D0777E|nr:ABC transporter ATP-binding protein [Candidatus Formimonas warabiya]